MPITKMASDNLHQSGCSSERRCFPHQGSVWSKISGVANPSVLSKRARRRQSWAESSSVFGGIHCGREEDQVLGEHCGLRCVGGSGRPRGDWGLRERRRGLDGVEQATFGRARRLRARVLKQARFGLTSFLRAPFYFCFLKVYL